MSGVDQRHGDGKLVAIYSSFPYQGKSEARKRLVEKHGYRHLPFARLIKRMVFVFLIQHGYTEEQAIDFIEVNKDVPIDRVGGRPTARRLMHTLGTDWGRNSVYVDLWLTEWEMKARTWMKSGVSVVADDLRFPNEAQAVKRLSGMLWRIERPSVQPTQDDLSRESEGRLNAIKFDRMLINDGTVGQLWKNCDKAVSLRCKVKLFRSSDLD
jgi:hypothetical protein